MARPETRAPEPLALWRNALTEIGTGLACLAALFLMSFLFFDLAAGGRNPYLGVFTYLVFPGLIVVGLVLLIAGLLTARWRKTRIRGERRGEVEYYPRVDLNLPHHRRAVMMVGAAALLTIPMVGLLSYRGYHFTDSNQFCGAVCHTVMEPEHAAYLQSPHARVGCVECHIGTGASWYVKSKLSGLRQVWKTAMNTFPRPVPPALTELRPATDTCRECHWPAKYYGNQLKTIDRFAFDQDNTRRPIALLLKTGGADPTTAPPAGIHWHMALGHSIDYVATDGGLQRIPWVRIVDQETGEARVYRSDGEPHDAPPPDGIRRTVDCMDCHNRPAHVFRSPTVAMDNALITHAALKTLPFAKREGVAALARRYESTEEAMIAIQTAIHSFYRDEMPGVWDSRRGDVDTLVKVARDIFRSNVFPKMNVNWRTYPNNIGHKIFPGCFRCHNGDHVDSEGTTISRECHSCHDFLAPGGGDAASATSPAGTFAHPMPLGTAHDELRCDQCHSGGLPPPSTCKACHEEVTAFRSGTLEIVRGLDIQPSAMSDTVQCEDCHDLTKPATIESIDAACMDCHDDEEDRFDGMLLSWQREIQQSISVIEGGGVHTTELNALRRAGPLHNMEAARAILHSLRPGSKKH